MRKLTIANKTIEVPSEWNELQDHHLTKLQDLLYERNTPQAIRVKLLLYILRARVTPYVYPKNNYKIWGISIEGERVFMDSAELIDLASVFDFLFDTEGRLDVRLTRTPFFRLETPRMMLMGPEDGLTNISYGQFVQTQSLLPLVKEDFYSYIDQFLCVLWKDLRFEPTEDGDPDWLADVNYAVKRIMLWYYVGSMRFIAEKFPRLFSGGESSTDENPFEAHQRIIDELAGGDVTKKEQVRRSPLFDVLYTLEMAIERREKEKQDNR